MSPRPPLGAAVVMAGLALALTAAPLLAAQAGEAPFRSVSDLAREGFTPFPVSAAGNASFGMMRETELYLCFIADRQPDQARRQSVLMAHINAENPDPTVPNIPVLCILTE